MTEWDCEKARAELEEYLHNELCAEDATDIRKHMAECAECASEAEVGKIMTEAVRRACQEKAPEDLRADVLRRIREAQATH